MNKPIICIDFDGVIHDYKEGWKDGEIYGNATPGFFRWAIAAKDHFKLVVYSSRSKTPEGIAAMREAIGRWAHDALSTYDYSIDAMESFVQSLEFSAEKPPAFLTIDDRAICFQGSWAALDPAELTQFRTWTEIDRSTKAGQFIDDYNRMIAGILNFCSKYDVPKPDLIFHPRMLDRMKAASGVRDMLGTLIFMGVRVRFGVWEQRDVLRER